MLLPIPKRGGKFFRKLEKLYTGRQAKKYKRMDQDGVLRDREKGTNQMKRRNGIEDDVSIASWTTIIRTDKPSDLQPP